MLIEYKFHIRGQQFLSVCSLWSRLKYLNNFFAMKRSTGTQVSQRMYPSVFADPLSFPSSATTRQTFGVLSEISQQLLDELP